MGPVQSLTALASLGQSLPVSVAPLVAVILEGHSSQKIASLYQVLMSHYFWKDTGRLCASATVSRAITWKENPYNDQASRDSAGNSIAWGTVPWKHPVVRRKGIRAININPRSYLTLFAWEADLPPALFILMHMSGDKRI